MYSPSGTEIVVSQQEGDFFFFAERMTSSTAVTVAAGDAAGVGPYRKQRVVSVFNYFAGTLDANGNPMDQTSTLAVASNDLNGSGVWNRRLIPVASEVTTVTGTPDVTSTAVSAR